MLPSREIDILQCLPKVDTRWECQDPKSDVMTNCWKVDKVCAAVTGPYSIILINTADELRAVGLDEFLLQYEPFADGK